MIYRECRPSPALRSLVERLWWLEGPAEAIGVEPIPPDGHAEIIVHAGDPFVERRDDDTLHVQERVLLAGQITRAVRLAPRGVARVVGARLRPDGAHRLLGARQDALTNQIVDLRDVHRALARRLRDDVTGREAGPDMIDALDRALRDIAPAAEPMSSARLAIAYAQRRRGLVRVPELAHYVGLSVRQLERVFAERVGLTPKIHLRIIRFQEVLRTLRGGQRRESWADLAAAHGYYDQAHFIRDFKRFVGVSPSAWHISHESLTALFSAMRRTRESDDVFFQDEMRAAR
jgi:AraC-like DNA-binding protein